MEASGKFLAGDRPGALWPHQGEIDVNASGRGLSALSDISDRLSQFAYQPLQTLILICALIP